MWVDRNQNLGAGISTRSPPLTPMFFIAVSTHVTRGDRREMAQTVTCVRGFY